MPQPSALPPESHGAAHRTRDADECGITVGRLRGTGVQHPYHGVFSIGLDLDGVLGRCRAYEPRLRPGEVFSHSTAARLYGIPLPPLPEELHVAGGSGQSRARVAGIIGHELSTRVNSTFVLGLPVTGPADTWCHLASILSREDLVAAGDALVTGKRQPGGRRLPALCSTAELEAAAARHKGARGRAAMLWALPRIRTGVDSRPETHLRLLLVAAGFPEPEIGPPIIVEGGRLTLHPDLAWTRWRIAIEYEGKEHWSNQKRMRSDIRRREMFEAAGWRVIRVVLDDLFVDPEAFLRRVETVVADRERELGL